MKWITIHSYVDLATGEIHAQKPREEIHIKYKKQKCYVGHHTGRKIKEVTLFYRRADSKQTDLFTTRRKR